MPQDPSTVMLAALGILALVLAAAIAGAASARLLLRAARRADADPRPIRRD
jgi:hypothetical protein